MTIDAPPLSDAEIRRLVERLDRPVVLVGMMGVGKSTVGRKLAALLHLNFCDADGSKLAGHMLHDKKMDAGTLPFVLLRGVGEAFLARDVQIADVAAFLDEQLRAH